jgi:hypothetical protein
MTAELSARELEFLRESNAIEDIENIDYADPANAQPGRGHVGAFLEMREAAARQRPIGLEDVCRWQRWITEEQTRFGHEMPSRGVGVARRRRAVQRAGRHAFPARISEGRGADAGVDRRPARATGAAGGAQRRRDVRGRRRRRVHPALRGDPSVRRRQRTCGPTGRETT